jgi:NDP-sugar pyrophosphorylase family protein
MKSMIFAAGLGSRLGDITNDMPKALVNVHGKPMIAHVINFLKDFGVNEIIVNVHHFGKQVIDYVTQNDSFGISISFSDETENLLDTGGGLINAAHFFNSNEPFFVHNVDILSRIDIGDMLEYHKKNANLATLAVKNRDTSRYFLVNNKQKVCGWLNTKTSEIKLVTEENNLQKVAFSGVQIVNPEIFKYCSLSGKFSLTDLYLILAKNHSVGVYNREYDWFDLGSPESISKAEKLFPFTD